MRKEAAGNWDSETYQQSSFVMKNKQWLSPAHSKCSPQVLGGGWAVEHPMSSLTISSRFLGEIISENEII